MISPDSTTMGYLDNGLDPLLKKTEPGKEV